MKKIVAKACACMCALALAASGGAMVGCSGNSSGSNGAQQSAASREVGYTFTDDLGNQVTVSSHERVVAGMGSFANIWELAGGTRVQASSTQTGTMLAELGASNITDADKSLLSDYSLESLVKADPDFIFLLPMGDSDEAAQKALKDQTTANPAWKELSAVKEDRVITLDPKLFLYKPNNNWDDAYEVLYEALYEDQREQK